MSADFEEQLISQLILDSSSIDQTAAAVFKTVFAAGRQGEFLRALGTYGARKDVEIERLCEQNFYQFAASIDELLGLQEEARRLKSTVQSLLEGLGRCGQLLYDTKVEMYETRKMLYSTQRTLLAVNDCLQALNTAQRATLEIMDQNFGQALRLIEQLQSSLLPRIAHFSFAARLQQYIPSQLATVRNFAVEELKRWLSTVREQSPRIGERAFGKAERRIEKWRELYEGVATPSGGKAGLASADDMRSAAAYVELVEMERQDAAAINDDMGEGGGGGAEGGALGGVDFGPLLKAVHLFDLMDQRGEFQSLFAEYRRAQAKVIFDMPVSLREGQAQSFATFLHHVTGFFIVEYFIVQQAQKFYSPAHVEGLWETAVGMINNYVLDSLGTGVADRGVFMKIKWLQVFFMHSIEVYELYSIASMLDTILSLFYRYVDLAKTDHSQSIQNAAASGALRALPLGSGERYLRLFGFLQASETHAPRGGNWLPFSDFVPAVYNGVAEFIGNFYVFLEGVPQQSGELDDIAKKNCEMLLVEAGLALEERLATGPDGEQVMQMVKDVQCLLLLLPDIAHLLSQRRLRNRSAPLSLTAASDALTEARGNLEGRLMATFNHDVDSLLLSHPFDPNPAMAPTGPSAFITGKQDLWMMDTGRDGNAGI